MYLKTILTTRHLKVFMLMLCMCFSFSAFAQKVTLNVENKPISEVLNIITKASGYKFIYSDVVKLNSLVSIKCENRQISSVLDEIFKNTNISYKIDGKNVALTAKEIDPRNKVIKSKISGIIKDDTGQVCPGATIKNEKSGEFTVSDVNGAFSIKANAGDRLTFTFIGLNSTSLTVDSRIKYDVLMNTDKEMLEEVVVTGYQDIQKAKVTGSITTISSKKIEDRYTANIMNNLEGRVAGLSTYGGKMTIRGASSLYAETSPLLVVDGLPIEGSISDLNPYDIENVNVLKDAAATAIYGARASNGIIVISTKNAKTKGKIDINFSSNITIHQKKNMNYSDNFYMNAEQQVNVESEYYDYYFFHNDGEVADPIASTYSSIEGGSGAVSPIEYAYYRLAKGEISQADLNSTLESLKKNNFAQEYADHVYRREVLQQYNLSVRSRSDLFQSNLTVNYKTDNSGTINTDQNQLNIGYKGIYDVTKWMTAEFSFNGIFSKAKEPGYDYNSYHTDPWTIPAYEKMYNDDGTSNNFYYWYNGNQYWSSKGEEGMYDLGVNIVDEFYNNVQTTDRNHSRYNVNLLFKIIKGLTANTQFIYENDHATTDWLANEQSHLSRSMRNAFAQKDASGKISYLTPRSGGMLNSTNTDGRYWTGRGQINYSNTFGKHSIVALAGLEFRQTKYKGTKALILGYDEQLQSSSTHTVDFGAMSLMNYSPYYMKGQYPVSQFVFGPYLRDNMGIVIEQRHRYASGYMNMTYTYEEKYNVFGSFRKDYADVYGLNAKYRGKPLWSVGASWNIHNEPFFKPVEWADYLKLRVSYGVTGNIYQGATSYMTATSTGMNEYTNLPYGEVESPANPNLKWEQSRTTDLGLDFSVLKNRIRGSIDVYNKVGKDIFSNMTLDPTTGFSSMFVNMASMWNRGVEVQLSVDWFRPEKIDGFNWETSVTASYNKNKVTDVENPSTRAYQVISNPYVKGYPSSAMWSYRFAGISDEEGEKGQTLWYVEDDRKTHSAQSASISTLEYSGQSEPKTIIAMENSFKWKGLSLNIMMAYYGGHKMRALCENETFSVSYSTIASYFLNAWTPENKTNTPGIGRYGSTSLGSETRYSNASVYDADFIKIRNIVLSYDLPRNWVEKISAERVALSFQVDNPRYLWVKNNIGVDPETLGIRTPSSYIFGVNINF